MESIKEQETVSAQVEVKEEKQIMAGKVVKTREQQEAEIDCLLQQIATVVTLSGTRKAYGHTCGVVAVAGSALPLVAKHLVGFVVDVATLAGRRVVENGKDLRLQYKKGLLFGYAGALQQLSVVKGG